MNGDLWGDTVSGTTTGAALGGPYGAAAGAALGLGKYFLLDRPKYKRQVALAANTQRFSPWTHLTAELPNSPDPFSNALGFGAAGAQLGQQFDQSSQNAKLAASLNRQVASGQGLGSTPALPGGVPLNFGTTSSAQPLSAPASSGSFWSSYADDINNPYYNTRRQGA